MNLPTSYVSQPRLKTLSILCGFPRVCKKNAATRGAHNKKSKYYSKYYRILELPEDADQDSVRRAFINLCKKYHPDSGNPAADSDKFQQIDDAYKALQNKFAEERWNVNEGIGEYGLYYDESKRKSEEEVKIFDIKHNAPQHRQYLSCGGFGYGTVSQRQKQFAAHQRMTAVENVYNHRIKKLKSAVEEHSLVIKDKIEAKKVKTRYGIERLVEDLIQESMAKGEFDNLKGAGKPLPESNYNPYVDLVTHKLNQVMIDNGFVPEWITLQKEINEDVEVIKRALGEERKTLGPLPLSRSEEEHWERFLDKINENVTALNKKIDKFNLVVPVLGKQKLRFNLVKESRNVLERNDCCRNGFKKNTAETESNTNDNSVYVFRQ